MEIRVKGNAIAIALAALAVVIAATGTAVAVTATSVQIVDGTTPSQIAKVDANGKLSVTTAAAPTSTINSAFFVTLGLSVLTSPTTATLAVSRLAMMNNANNASYPNTNFLMALVRVTPPASDPSNCYSGSAAVSTQYSIDRLAVGANVQDLYPAPLKVSSVGGQKYCLAIKVYGETSSPGTYYLPFVQLTGYVLSGSYPAGAGAPAVDPAAGPPLATPADPHPAGAAPLQ